MKPLSILQITFFITSSILIISCEDSTMEKSAQLRNSDYKMDQNTLEPKAEKKEYILEKHGHQRNDPYYWLREKENPQVIDYLNKENQYREAVTKHTKRFQEDLFEELKDRIKEQDESVPYFKNGYHYYTRFEIGMEHPIYCRKKESLESPEEILLNVNELAEGHAYYAIGGLSVSPNNRYIGFSEDTLSRRLYTLKIKDLQTGEILEDEIQNTSGGSVWAKDNQTLFYTLKDTETLRTIEIKRHQKGSSSKSDVTVFEEKDEAFYCGVGKDKSGDYLIIGTGSTLSDEVLYLSADTPNGKFIPVQKRQAKLEYGAEPYNGYWYIRTNYQGATNFKLMRAPIGNSGLEKWEDVIPHHPDVYFEGMEIFKNYLVIEDRKKGSVRIRYRKWDEEKFKEIPFNDPTYTAGIGINPEYDRQWLRYGYTSLTTPTSTFEYNFETGETKLLKQQEIVGGYNGEEYASEKIWAKGHDGVEIPISLVYKKSLKKPEGNPLLLYAYGSYGSTIDPSFSSIRLTLLDRGFIFAIAHVRGGSFLGRPWYENGKMFNKKNTFEDFISVAEHLVANNYTQTDKLFAQGGSAGGLLMGAILNMRPDLWKGVIAAVPFVDVVTTMLDESIPLTTGEYDEWGNPNNKDSYEYMLSYSPYDQVEEKAYPAILVTTGLHDSQVQYWEPAKWVAKLRELRTDKSVPLLLYCNMDTGHGGASGRFEPLKEVAMEYAFILDLVGINE